MRRSLRTHAIAPFALGLLVASACADDERSVDLYPSGGSEGGAGTAAEPDGTDDGAGSDTEGSGETGGEELPKYDVAGPGPMDPDGGDDGTCTKVDFLFVVDDSSSMRDNQTNLVDNFPRFAEDIQSTLVNVDSYHIGVVTTDDYYANEPGCRTMGALVTQTASMHPASGFCGPGGTSRYAEGHRYMTEADDLPARFLCAGQPGTGGSNWEEHAHAIAKAISPAMNQPGACNAGFVRDDALLIVVIITDEDDTDSPGTPPQWVADVVQAKGGVEENVVMMSIVSTIGTPYPSSCVEEEAGLKLIEFTESFSNAFVGDVCAPDYGVVFQDALGLIKSACDDFRPPG